MLSRLKLRKLLRAARLDPFTRSLTKLTDVDGLSSPDPEYTSKRYAVKRGDYSTLQDRDVVYFENLLDKSRVVTDAFDLEKYNVDWLKSVRGRSHCALKPRNTREVSAILNYCNEKRLAVVPQGGNIGLVGGSVPVFEEVIISTELMTDSHFAPDNPSVIIAGAGCVLEKLDEKVAGNGLMIPLDLGAKGSCQIGGSVSTNAGRIRVLRYRNLHGFVVGVEAVLADGTIFDGMSTVLKNNTGYDLRHLFIGSEGTLGVVTKVAIVCPQRPKNVTVCFLAGCAIV